MLLVMPVPDPPLENVLFVTTPTIVLTDNSVVHLKEDVVTLKLFVTVIMSIRVVSKIVTLVMTHTS